MNKIFAFAPTFLVLLGLLGFAPEAAAASCSSVCDDWDHSCVPCAGGGAKSFLKSPRKNNNKSKKPPVASKAKTPNAEVPNANVPNANAQPPAPEKPPGEDISAMVGAVEECRSALSSAKSECDQDQDTGVQGARTDLANFAANMGPAIANQIGINGVCSGMAKYLGAANAAVAAFSVTCSSAKSSCIKTCQEARVKVSSNPQTEATYGPQVSVLSESCRDLEVQIQQAGQAIDNVVGSIQGAQACANQTDSELFSFCKSNPNAVGCSNIATDCSNPTVAASNPICICKANPTAESCTGLQAKALDGRGGGSYDTSSMTPNGTGSGSANIDSGLLGNVDWQGDPNYKADTSRSEDIGGNKGGRPLMDGGAGGGGGGSGGGGGGAHGDGIAVNSGFRGGGGGGGGWSSGGGSGDGNGGPQAIARGTAGAGGPDLRQFLPGQKFDPKMRGMAGMTGPDGITGPHSDIWRKIQNRYQVEKSKLMP